MIFPFEVLGCAARGQARFQEGRRGDRPEVGSLDADALENRK